MVATTPGSSASRVGVVTVSYDSGEVLSTFLDSIAVATSLSPAVVVVDNFQKSDDSIQALTTSRRAHYLRMAGNIGYGGAMNAGLASLPKEVEWVLLSNPDVILSPGVIDALVCVGDEDPAIAAVGPAVLNTDGTVYPSAREVPSLRTGIGHALFSNLWTNNPWSVAYKHETGRGSERRDAGWLSGSCILVRRSVFEGIGGFDDGYFMYFEDVDLGFRFGQLGYRNVYYPSVRIRHSGAHSTASDSRRMIAAHHDSARRFISRKYPGALLWPVRAVLSIGLSMRSAITLRRLEK